MLLDGRHMKHFWQLMHPCIIGIMGLTADSWYSWTNDTNVGFRDVLSSLNPPEKPNVECHSLLVTISFKKSFRSPGTFKTFHCCAFHSFDDIGSHFSFPPVTLILVWHHWDHGLLCSSINQGPYKITFLFLLNWGGSVSISNNKIFIKVPHLINHFTTVGPFSYNMITDSGTCIFVFMLLWNNLLHTTKRRNHQCKCHIAFNNARATTNKKSHFS